MSSATAPTSWLPEGAREIERVDDEVVVDGIPMRRTGICIVTPGGHTVTGSAASHDGRSDRRAEWEALERAATIEGIHARPGRFVLRDRLGRRVGLLPQGDVFSESDDPACWAYARSNGVALHEDWTAACDRAWCELVERDHVLRAWYGITRPLPLAVEVARTPLARTGSYRWRFARFAGEDPSSSTEVVGAFGFPTEPSAPLVVGYAGRESVEAALVGAIGEALQQLAFLWGEAIPDARPAPGPTALHHLEAMLWPGAHESLARWLDDGHPRPAGPLAPPLRAPDGFVDLTPPGLAGRLRVARAIARDAVPLVFGLGPLGLHLADGLRLHPIA